MLKIFIVIPQLGSDGVTNSTLLYMEHMDRTNMDIHIGVASEQNESLDTQIGRVEKLGIPIHFFPSRSSRTVKYCIALKKYLEEYKINILHVMGNSATMAVEMSVAKICKVPIRIAHCHNTECKYKICNLILKPVLFRAATDFFACGIGAGNYLYGSRKFTVIPNGQDIKKFLFHSENRQEIRNRMNVGAKKIIGHVGKFTEQKNHTFLIDVFEEVCKKSDDYELWLIGEGGEKEEEIFGKVKTRGLTDKVRFWGLRTDVEKILSAMDIMVLPSLYEGLPNVVIEWQISGLPCLLSDTITRECKIMDNVKYLSLNNSADQWIDEILNVQFVNRAENQADIFEKMSSAGYDIKEDARSLRDIYFQYNA